MRLTPEQIEAIRKLILDAHVEAAVDLFGPDGIPLEVLERAIEEGVLTEEQAAEAGRGILGDGYLLGHELHRDFQTVRTEDLASFRQRAEHVHGALSSWEQDMAKAARMHGAALVVGLGNRVADGMVTTIISSDNAQARAYRRKIADATAEAVEARETWTRLRGTLGEALDDDWARDLGRIAATELQAAVNAGIVDAIEGMDGADAEVAVIPQPDACDTCRGWYLDGGRPRIFKLGQLAEHGANVKKKKADWVPTVPPAHPWCHCQLVYVPEGWHFDDAWELQPPEIAKSVDSMGAELLRKADGAGATFVSIPIPPELAGEFDHAWKGKHPPHITLAYLGRPGPGRGAAIRDALRETSAAFPPVRIRVGGLDHFVGEDEVVAYAKVAAPGIEAMRNSLVANLEARGIPVPTEHGFVPHVTLAYLPRQARWAGTIPSGIFTANAVELTSPTGTEVFPLGAR